jgi:hypothetical protein
MKIRIKRANTTKPIQVAYWLDNRQWWLVQEYVDELRQAAIWSKE